MAAELERLRRIGRTVRLSRPGQWCFVHALAGPRRPGRAPAGLRWLSDRVLAFDIARPDFRRSTVDALVELFFELVEAWRLERFVEAGAKDAGASIRASRLATIDRAVAFEANPYTHRRFESTLAETDVVYEHLALTNGASEATFNVRLDERGQPIADGQGSLYARKDHAPGHETVSVPGVRLDDYFANEPDRRSALWIDVEGALDVVLRGANELLGSVDVALVEVEERPYWDDRQWLRRDVDGFLGRLGLVPVARDQQSRHQYNVLYVRQSLLDDPALRAAYACWRRGRRRRAPSQTVYD